MASTDLRTATCQSSSPIPRPFAGITDGGFLSSFIYVLYVYDIGFYLDGHTTLVFILYLIRLTAIKLIALIGISRCFLQLLLAMVVKSNEMWHLVWPLTFMAANHSSRSTDLYRETGFLCFEPKCDRLVKVNHI